MISKKIVGMLAVVCMVATAMGGLVVYAAMSATLNIEGAADFVPESWSVKFKGSSLSKPTLANGGLTGGASVQTAPTLSDTAIGDFRVRLTLPGDSVTYTFTVENTGSLDARLSTFISSDPTCVGTGATATADANLVCSNNLVYTLRYVGGNLPQNSIAHGQTVAQNDLLRAGTELQLELKLEYSQLATANPVNTVTIGGLGRTLIYSVN